ncbi:MAG: UxaA family hydrolase [Promethearchaeota archaeon]
MKQRKYIILNSKDNCATSLEDIHQGTQIKILEKTIVITQKIQMGHKFALNDINKGDKIIKYGEIIGIATTDIKKGEWVHTHNITSSYLEGKADE